ncbi:hypothetical protein PENTCL1PPCAC_805, partial [Pristionchus entomophagus]
DYIRSWDLGSSLVFEPQHGVSDFGIDFWKACVAVTLADDAYEMSVAIIKDYRNETILNTVHETARVVGSWAPVIPCAKFGANFASSVSDKGALVGAIAGGVIGSYCGELVACKLAQTYIPAPKPR